MQQNKNMLAGKIDKIANHAFWQAAAPAKWEYWLAACLCIGCFFLFGHPDVMETANHSWLFLDHLFSGQLLAFYDNVLAHSNTMVYWNGAHYNIFVYVVFGLAELPLYLVCKLASVMPDPFLLTQWGKAVSCLFLLLSARQTQRIAQMLGFAAGKAQYAALAVVVSPIVLVGTFSMGQYDSICLFFMLLGIAYYLQNRMTAFSLVMGVALVCKFFALLVFVPLLLLFEKRLSRIVLHGVTSLWLTAITSVLFRGRTGDMSVFNTLMAEQVLAKKLPGGIADFSIVLVGFALLCAVCFCWRPAAAARGQTAVYAAMAPLALVFLCARWHPQWLVLLVPFLVLTTFGANNKTPWLLIDALLCAAFLVESYLAFPGQIEANMLDSGVLGLSTGFFVGHTVHNDINFYLALLPFAADIAAGVFAGCLLLTLLGKLPLRGAAAADCLDTTTTFAPSLRAGVWGSVLAVFVCLFLVPCAFVWLKCFVLPA